MIQAPVRYRTKCNKRPCIFSKVNFFIIRFSNLPIYNIHLYLYFGSDTGENGSTWFREFSLFVKPIGI